MARSSAPLGRQTPQAEVTDNDGATATASVTLNVVDANNQPPQVAIDFLSSPVTIEQNQVLTLQVSASDPDAKVQLEIDSSSPYEFSWPAATAGSHSIVARAFDSKNDNAISNALQVTVLAGNQSPVAAITAPAAQAQFAVNEAVTITTNVSDSDGSMPKLNFLSITS